MECPDSKKRFSVNEEALEPKNEIIIEQKKIRAEIIAGKIDSARTKADTLLKRIVENEENWQETIGVMPILAYESIGITFYMAMGDIEKLQLCFLAVEAGKFPKNNTPERRWTKVPYFEYAYVLENNPGQFHKLVETAKSFFPPNKTSKWNTGDISQFGFICGMAGDFATAERAIKLLQPEDNKQCKFIEAGIALGKARKSNPVDIDGILAIYNSLPKCNETLRPPTIQVFGSDSYEPYEPLGNWLLVTAAKSQYMAGDIAGAKKTLTTAAKKLDDDDDSKSHDAWLTKIATTQMLIGDVDGARKTVAHIEGTDKAQMLALSGDLAAAKKLCANNTDALKQATLWYTAGLACQGKNAEAEKFIQAELPNDSWAHAYYFIAELLMQKGKWLGPIKDK